MDAVEHSIQHHDASIGLLIELAKNHTERMEELQGLQVCQQTLLEEPRRQTAEIKVDAAMTRRLWVRLAERHGWIEDEDWLPPSE